jgi:hypothetical protein
MIYSHKNFILDTENRRVFDENDKELRITGNALRVLVYLCKNKIATVTDLGDYLDHAFGYTEEHLRQYRYKINTIIGHDVVEYKNNIYSVAGEVVAKNASVSELLKLRETKEPAEKPAKKRVVPFYRFPAINAAVILVAALLPWPYGYYTFLRIAVTGIAIYYGYYIYENFKINNFWFWGMVVVTLIFNPIFPIYLGDRLVWGIIDVIVAGFFVGVAGKIKNKELDI